MACPSLLLVIAHIYLTNCCLSQLQVSLDVEVSDAFVSAVSDCTSGKVVPSPYT